MPATTDVTPWKQERVRGRVPEDLGVVVRVDVDEAGGDDASGGVDPVRLVDAGRQVGTDLDDATVLDGDVGPEPRASRAVDDGPTVNDQPVRHVRPPRSPANYPQVRPPSDRAVSPPVRPA
ncbi:MAG: hypothetical protein R2710_02170 [Acidimicrobiales bacterium]